MTVATIIAILTGIVTIGGLILSIIQKYRAGNVEAPTPPMEVHDAPEDPALNPTRDDVMSDLGVLQRVPAPIAPATPSTGNSGPAGQTATDHTAQSDSTRDAT